MKRLALPLLGALALSVGLGSSAAVAAANGPSSVDGYSVSASAPDAARTRAAGPLAMAVGAVRQPHHAIGGCAYAKHTRMMANHLAAALRELRGATFERAFLAEMISHHRMAVDLATLALERGAREPVKELARMIIANQRREIDDLTGWLKAWYGLTPEQAAAQAPESLRMRMRMMEMHARHTHHALMEVPAGQTFDRKFLQTMIAHHASAIVEAKTVPGRATHAKLIGLARVVVTSQGREIHQMTRWLADWYDAGPCDRR